MCLWAPVGSGHHDVDIWKPDRAAQLHKMLLGQYGEMAPARDLAGNVDFSIHNLQIITAQSIPPSNCVARVRRSAGSCLESEAALVGGTAVCSIHHFFCDAAGPPRLKLPCYLSKQCVGLLWGQCS